jgi:hypothetical protein
MRQLLLHMSRAGSLNIMGFLRGLLMKVFYNHTCLYARMLRGHVATARLTRKLVVLIVLIVVTVVTVVAVVVVE